MKQLISLFQALTKRSKNNNLNEGSWVLSPNLWSQLYVESILNFYLFSLSFHRCTLYVLLCKIDEQKKIKYLKSELLILQSIIRNDVLEGSDSERYFFLL